MGPVACYGKTTRLLSGNFKSTGETASSTILDSREAFALSGDLILFTEDPLDQPENPVPVMIAGS